MFVRQSEIKNLYKKIEELSDKLKEQTEKQYTARKDRIFPLFWGDEPLEPVPTLRGEVDAIIKHLKLEVSVKEGTGRKVVAKVKSTKKAK